MRDLALLQPALMNLAEDAPWFIHMAVEPLKQIWKLHPDLNISTIVPPTTNLVQIHNNQLGRRRTCYNNDIISDGNSSIGNGNGHTNANASSSPPGTLIGGIVGGVIGGILLLTLIGVFLYIFLRRRRRRVQEQRRQANLNQALKGASTLDPYSRRVTPGPGLQQVGLGYGTSGGGGAGMSVSHNYVPMSPPITASTGGTSSPHTYGGGWGGGGSTSFIPQSRGGYYTHPTTVTGPQISDSVPGRSSYS